MRLFVNSKRVTLAAKVDFSGTLCPFSKKIVYSSSHLVPEVLIDLFGFLAWLSSPGSLWPWTSSEFRLLHSADHKAAASRSLILIRHRGRENSGEDNSICHTGSE